ncbi:MAG: hypothetical protein HY023_05775, partial [Chloroflexi bacterium]|nr:hypothetical protein [Chloroflexota bacterium]
MIIAILTAIGYVALVITTLRRDRLSAAERWMAGYAALSLAFAGVSVAGSLGLTANLNAAISPARMLVVFDLLSAGLIGAATFDYLDQQGGWIWATAFAALTIGIAALDLYD